MIFKIGIIHLILCTVLFTHFMNVFLIHQRIFKMWIHCILYIYYSYFILTFSLFSKENFQAENYCNVYSEYYFWFLEVGPVGLIYIFK